MTHLERFILYVLLATSLMDGIDKDMNAVAALALIVGSAYAMFCAAGESLVALKDFFATPPKESEAPQ